jgi:asparagine synthase (glutamine-hydrolysing)
MSIQFGKCNFDGRPVDPKDLEEVRPVLAPFGPDGEGYICKDNLAVIFRAFHTTNESRHERQPHVSRSGSVITWDGRLDNREDLIERLSGVSTASTDVEIVAAAHEYWGDNAFRELIGDWALSLWKPKEKCLLLAKDFLGTRHLYYTVKGHEAAWCSILDPLVVFASRPVELDEEYIAGWLSFFPAPHLTPYTQIYSVPPSSFVRLAIGQKAITKYWDFDPAKRIRFDTDAEYEEHFRSLFVTSVRRRLRAPDPILAELSGGMDSSSIVCIADDIIAKGRACTPRLDTVSYYDDSEPNWNERPYFAKVEERRGRAGLHIDVGAFHFPVFECGADRFVATPASIGMSNRLAKELSAHRAQHFSVMLSGIGGDEVMGGVVTPLPELQNLLAGIHLRLLARQLKVWALNQRRPWFHLLFEAIGEFLPRNFAASSGARSLPTWLAPDFVRRNRTAIQGYKARLNFFGAPPSFQENMRTFDAMCRQFACNAVSAEPLYEKRYPYLDRDLLEFLYAIPPEQLVCPGQRRSLMRRALVGIVPDEILNRRRKAFVDRGPRVAIHATRDRLLEMASEPLSSALGVVDAKSLREALEQVQSGQEIPIVGLMRTLTLEMWLRNVVSRGFVRIDENRNPSSTPVRSIVTAAAKTSLS